VHFLEIFTVKPVLKAKSKVSGIVRAETIYRPDARRHQKLKKINKILKTYTDLSTAINIESNHHLTGKHNSKERIL